MLDFVQYTLAGTSVVLTLVFTGLLVLLCIHTRSTGLIIITAVLAFPPTLGLIPSYFIGLYIDQWAGGEINNWLTQRMTVGEFVISYDLVRRLLHDGLLVLGSFLIYREWRRGKIRWNWQRSSEVVNHA
jgi:hypothetical protein